jgi:hypothetical protein
MPKATAKSTTKKKSKASPQKGLAFINAAYQRKSAPEPNLKRELKIRKHPADVEDLVVLYDAYMAAVWALRGIANQPRAEGVASFIDDEWNYLVAKAWSTAEHLKGLRPTKYGDRENFIRVLLDCAFEMGGNAEDAASVFNAAMAVGTADNRDFGAARKGGA